MIKAIIPIISIILLLLFIKTNNEYEDIDVINISHNDDDDLSQHDWAGEHLREQVENSHP